MGASKDTAGLSRAERKSKKRQLEDAIPDLPGDDQGVEEPKTGETSEGKSKKRKRNGDEGDVDEEARKAAKKEKKRQKSEAAAAAEEGNNSDGGAAVAAADGGKKKKSSKKEAETVGAVEEAKGEVTEEARKSKKERKAERKAKEAAEAEAKPKEEAVVEGDGEVKPAKKNNRNREKKRKAAAEGGEKEARFICFIGMLVCHPTHRVPPNILSRKDMLITKPIGNLPFTATTQSIQQHFAKIKPKSVRHITQKEDPKKSKGIAFLEFEGYDHMKTCLKLFHHSMFDDGVSAARKINVELT